MFLFDKLHLKSKNVNSELSFDDRIIGSLYGFFVGDALGVPVEFLSRSVLSHNPIVAMEEYGTHNQPKGTWSDDSSMVLATMDFMCNERNSFTTNEKIDYSKLMDCFSKWAFSGDYTPRGITFDIGNATRYALERYRSNKENVFCGVDDINYNGNGSLMRIIPISLYESISKSEIDYNLIKDISSLTHAHILSVMSCYIYSYFIKRYMMTLNKKEAYSQTMNFFKSIFSKKSDEKYGNLEICKKYFDRLIYNDISILKEKNIKSSGFVIDTLEAVFWCILNTNNYKEAVLKAVNLGDDTDTVAALTGALAGLIYGIDDIPSDWINQLQRKDFLDEMINKYLSFIKLLKGDKKEF